MEETETPERRVHRTHVEPEVSPLAEYRWGALQPERAGILRRLEQCARDELAALRRARQAQRNVGDWLLNSIDWDLGRY